MSTISGSMNICEGQVSIKTLSRYTTKKDCPFKWAVDRKTGRRVKRFDSEEISSWHTMFTTISDGGSQRFLEISKGVENNEKHNNTDTSAASSHVISKENENELENRRARSGEVTVLLRVVEILEKQVEVKDQMIADLMNQIRTMTPKQLEYKPEKEKVGKQLSVGEQLVINYHENGLSPEKIVSKLKKKGMARHFKDKITLKKVTKILSKIG